MDGAEKCSPTSQEQLQPPPSPSHLHPPQPDPHPCDPHQKDALAVGDAGALVSSQRKYSTLALAGLRFLGIFTATHLSVCLFIVSFGTIVTGVLSLTGSKFIPTDHVANGILHSVGITVLVFGSLIFTLSIAILAFACKWGKESKLFSPTVTPCPVGNGTTTVTKSFELGHLRQLILSQQQQLQQQPRQLTAPGDKMDVACYGHNLIKSQDVPVDGSLVQLTDGHLYPSDLLVNHSQGFSAKEAIDTGNSNFGGIGNCGGGTHGGGGGGGGGRPLAVMIHASDQRQQPNNHSLASLHLKTQSATQLAPVSVTQCDSLPLPLDAANLIPNSSMGPAATTAGHPFPPHPFYPHPYYPYHHSSPATGHFISGGHQSISSSSLQHQQPHILTHPPPPPPPFNPSYYHNNNGHNLMPLSEASAPPYHQIQGDS